MDHNFRYAGKEGLSRNTVLLLPAEPTDLQRQFLQVIERCTGTGLSLPVDQGECVNNKEGRYMKG
tara:strand:+ start:455817 stop:456011 length:195 start_codon:yes stop_codon:yes gene_type:complete